MTATRAYAWPRVSVVIINAGTDAADGADLAGAVGMRMPCGAYHLPDRAITQGQVVGLRWEDAAVVPGGVAYDLCDALDAVICDGVDSDDQVVSALIEASERVDYAIHDTKHDFYAYMRRVEA